MKGVKECGRIAAIAMSIKHGSLKSPLWLVVYAIALTLLPPMDGRAQTSGTTDANAPDRKSAFPRPNWNLKYRSGPYHLKKEHWLKGAFVIDGSRSNEASPIAVIGRDQVRAIYFNAVAQKDSDAVERELRSGCYAASSLRPHDTSVPGPNTFVVWQVSLKKLTRAAAHLDHRYPVKFVWSDSGTDKDLVLSVDYCEYAAFVANLRWFAGSRWRDVGHEFPR